MKRLPPAKRNQLIIVMLITVALIGAVYFLLISPQKTENSNLAKEISDSQNDLSKYKRTISLSLATSNQLADVSAQLDQAEADIATGDVYSWTYDTIRHFKAGYHVDIPTIGQPTVSELDMLPNFPYKQLTLSLSGTAYYHDLGKFVSDFENTFPHMRLVNLAIEPGDTSERLSFRVDVVALVKPNS